MSGDLGGFECRDLKSPVRNRRGSPLPDIVRKGRWCRLCLQRHRLQTPAMHLNTRRLTAQLWRENPVGTWARVPVQRLANGRLGRQTGGRWKLESVKSQGMKSQTKSPGLLTGRKSEFSQIPRMLRACGTARRQGLCSERANDAGVCAESLRWPRGNRVARCGKAGAGTGRGLNPRACRSSESGRLQDSKGSAATDLSLLASGGYGQ